MHLEQQLRYWNEANRNKYAFVDLLYEKLKKKYIEKKGASSENEFFSFVSISGTTSQFRKKSAHYDDIRPKAV